MQDTYEVSEAVQSYVTARKHTCLRVSVQGARMPLVGGPEPKAVPIREHRTSAEIRIFRYGACKHI